MKVEVKIIVRKDYSNVPVDVEISEEIVVGDFSSDEKTEQLRGEVVRLVGEAVARAEKQIRGRRMIEESKEKKVDGDTD